MRNWRVIIFVVSWLSMNGCWRIHISFYSDNVSHVSSHYDIYWISNLGVDIFNNIFACCHFTSFVFTTFVFRIREINQTKIRWKSRTILLLCICCIKYAILLITILWMIYTLIPKSVIFKIKCLYDNHTLML